MSPFGQALFELTVEEARAEAFAHWHHRLNEELDSLSTMEADEDEARFWHGKGLCPVRAAYFIDRERNS